MRTAQRFGSACVARPLIAGISLLFGAVSSFAQVHVSIEPNTTVRVSGTVQIQLGGDWRNSGTFTPDQGTLGFRGVSGAQHIANSSTGSFNNLVVNNVTGTVLLDSSLSVLGALTVTNGDLDLNGHVLSLGSNASVTETSGNTVKGSGTITGSASLNAPSANNVFGLGATISSAANLGTTTITRGHTAQVGGAHTGILRYFDILPSTNYGLNATLVISYDESELNGIPEADLQLFRSTDAGATWTEVAGTVNTTANTVTATGLDGFSRWTLASQYAALPVQLTTLSATSTRTAVALNWRTETETENAGWEVERRTIANFELPIPNLEGQTSGHSQLSLRNPQWSTLGFVPGAHTSTSPKEYTFTDSPSPGRYAYRLEQLDRNGVATISQEAEVEVGVVPKVFSLGQNYPNPFNPTTMIEFTVPEDGRATLRVYDMLGREVATLFDGQAKAGYLQRTQFDAARLSSGLYFARLDAAHQRATRRMILMK